MRVDRGFVLVCVGFVLLTCIAAEAKDESGPKTVFVDCEKGDSINDALEEKANALIIEFTGTCHENVVIRRDNVTIRGDSSDATIIGADLDVQEYAVIVTMASKITLSDFTVRDSRNALVVQDGSSLHLEGVKIEENEGWGLTVGGGSHVILSGCSFLRNGQWGISAWGNSSLKLAPDQTTVSSENGGGLLLSTGSGLQGGNRYSRLELNDNKYGFASQFEASAQIAQIEAHRNGAGVSMSSSTLSAFLDVRDNYVGVWLQRDSQLDMQPRYGIPMVPTLTGNGSAVWADSGARLNLSDSEIYGNDQGILLDGGTARINGSTISDDMQFEFGSQVDFVGGNTITGPISCDDTVLVRGDAACAVSKAVAVEPLKTERKVPNWLKADGPFVLEEALKR